MLDMKSGNIIVPSITIRYGVNALLVSGVALGAANAVTILILKQAFIVESVVGCVLALVNAAATRLIEQSALRRDKTDFVKFLLVFSFARFGILFAILVLVAWQTRFNKSALFFAFMIEYLILLIYHMTNIKMGIKDFNLFPRTK